MTKFSMANVIAFRAEQVEQPQSNYLPSEYPILHCQYCGGVMYGWMDSITGEVIYECNKPRSESNDNPHHLVLAVQVQEARPLDRRCNLVVVK